VKIYAAAAAVEALRKKERQDETQFSLCTTKIDGFLSFMLFFYFIDNSIDPKILRVI
jgi:hypothetical protein